MITYQKGNILHADVEALVNTVNCVGFMGRGIALQFRKEYPENFQAYRNACNRGELRPGRMFVFQLGRFDNPRYVVNFPTKRHWKGKSRIEDIELGLKALVEEVRNRGIKSVAVPSLGCGLGGLRWSQVRPLIAEAFDQLPDVEVVVYEPTSEPVAEKMPKAKKCPGMTPGRAALLGLMRRYLAALMDPSISLLEIHKLMYFMQNAGEPLRLRFVKGPYGPYAENLRHVFTEIDGYFVHGYGDAEDDPEKQIELDSEASEQAERFLQKHPRTHARFDRVGELIGGFETPYGMELLATTHWLSKHESAVKEGELVDKFYAWNDRKRMFQEQHIRIARQVLGEKGWLANG